MQVKLGTLKDKGEALVTFLEPRVGAKPSLSGDTIEIDDGSFRVGVRPRHVKTYIKRFLFMNGVRKDYRVFVAGKELTLQELERGEDEEEKKKEEKESPKAEEKAETEADEKKDDAPKEEKPKKAPAKKKTTKKKAEPEA